MLTTHNILIAICCVINRFCYSLIMNIFLLICYPPRILYCPIWYKSSNGIFEQILCANPSQVFTPAQCYPMGRSGCPYHYGVCIWPEWGGEPSKREPEGALPFSHTGVRGEHRGWRGLHPVLYQRYEGVGVEHSSWGGRWWFVLFMCMHSEEKQARKPTDLGPTKARCAVSGYRLNEIRTCWHCRLGLYAIDSLILHANKRHCCRCLP